MAKKKMKAPLSMKFRGMLNVYIALTMIVVMSIWLCSCQKEKGSSPDSVAKTVTEEVPNAKVKIPRLVELGAEKCIPCKMMAPILAELKVEYVHKLQVDFIDVWKNPKASKQYGIRVIPTQIFYDVNGEEFYRHQGFIDKGDILAAFRKNGIDFGEK